MTLISIGASGSALSPAFVGWMKVLTGSLFGAIAVLASLFLASLVALYFCTPDRSASLRARGAPLRRHLPLPHRPQAKAIVASSPSFGGIGSTQSLGGRGSFRPLVGIGAQPFGGRGPGAIGPQPFIGRGPQTPSGGMQGDRR